MGDLGGSPVPFCLMECAIERLLLKKLLFLLTSATLREKLSFSASMSPITGETSMLNVPRLLETLGVLSEEMQIELRRTVDSMGETSCASIKRPRCTQHARCFFSELGRGVLSLGMGEGGRGSTTFTSSYSAPSLFTTRTGFLANRKFFTKKSFRILLLGWGEGRITLPSEKIHLWSGRAFGDGALS